MVPAASVFLLEISIVTILTTGAGASGDGVGCNSNHLCAHRIVHNDNQLLEEDHDHRNVSRIDDTLQQDHHIDYDSDSDSDSQSQIVLEKKHVHRSSSK